MKETKSAVDSKEEEIGTTKTPELSSSKSTTTATGFSQADLEIKDPLNNGKIMTRNCYSFPKIR